MIRLLLVVSFFLNIVSLYAQDTNKERAVLAYYNGNLEVAREYSERELRINPKNCYANYLMAHICNDENKLDSAIYYINTSIRNLTKGAFESYHIPYILRANLKYKLQSYNEALDDVNRVLKINKSKNYIMFRAELNSKLGNIEESNRELLELLSTKFRLDRTYYILSLNALETKQYQTVLDYIGKGSKIKGKTSLDWNQLRIETYIALKDTSNLLSCFDDMASSELSVKHWCLVKAYPLIGKQMKERLDKRIANGHGTFNNILYRMFILKEMRLFDEAINDLYLLDKLADDKNNQFYISYFRAECYNNMGSYAEALIDVNNALKLRQNAQLYHLRARIRFNCGIFDESIKDHETAVRMDSQNLRYVFGLLSVYSNLGDNEKVRSALNDLYEKEPQHRTVIYKLADANRKLNHNTIAKSLYELLLETDTIANDYSFRHKALFYLGRKNEAIQWVEQMKDSVVKTDAEQYRLSIFYYNLASFYALSEDSDQAIDYLSKSFEMGFVHVQAVENDIDFKALKDDSRFKELLDKYKLKFNPDAYDVRRIS